MNKVESEWKEMDLKYENLRDNYLIWCKLVFEMKDRQQDIANRYDISQSRISQMTNTGKNYNYFISNTNKLPKSNYAIDMMSSLPNDSKRNELLKKNPNPTQEDVKKYKNEINQSNKNNAKPKLDKLQQKKKKIQEEKNKQEKEERWERKQIEQEKIVIRNQALKTLGVSKGLYGIIISEKALKFLYRGFSNENHPDKGGIKENFIKIKQAYEILK